MPAIGGIVRAGKMVDKALDAGRTIDKSRGAEWIGRILESEKDWKDFERAFGLELDPYVRKSFVGGRAEVTLLAPGKQLAKYGKRDYGYFTSLLYKSTDAKGIRAALALPSEASLKAGGRVFEVTKRTMALKGVTGPQEIYGRELVGGALQYYIPNDWSGGLKVLGNSWFPM